MIMRWLGLILSLLVATPCPAQGQSIAPIDPDRQILVMLRLVPPHFRAGRSYAGGYGEDQSRAGRQRIAAAVARRHGLTLESNWPMPVIGIDCFVMTVPVGREPGAVIDELARESAIEWAQPVARYHGLADSQGDPMFAAQPVAKAWRLAALHRAATGRGATIAVIDSQIDTAHPDLAGQVKVSRDFVGVRAATAENHGTGVAGVIAAKLANGIGSAGIAPSARLYALRACWQTASGPTVCDTLSLAKAIAFAIEQRVDVINLSLGGPSDRLLASLLKAGMARGAVVVAAFDMANPGGFPASLASVIAVASTPVDGASGPYSAPGRDIPTTQPGGRWYLVSGASYAAAEVSGLLALVRERHGARMGAQALVSARNAGGEIDGCATVLGRSPMCGQDDAVAVNRERHR